MHYSMDIFLKLLFVTDYYSKIIIIYFFMFFIIPISTLYLILFYFSPLCWDKTNSVQPANFIFP